MSTQVVLYMWPPADGLPSSSPFCLKALYALAYKGIPHRVEYVRTRMLDWVISGKLPAAEIQGPGGSVVGIEDSTAILKQLDRVKPEAPLLYPPDRGRRAETNLLEEWSDESLALHLVYHRWAIDENFAKFMPQAFGSTPSESRDRAVEAAREFHNELFRDRGIASLSQSERRERFSDHLDVLEQRLERGSFLTGPDGTAADLAAYAPLQVSSIR